MKLINSLKELQDIISKKGQLESLDKVHELKIEISNQNLSLIDFKYLFSEVFPNCTEIILAFGLTQLNNSFLQNLQAYLEQQNQNFKIFFKFYQNKFTFSRVKSFIQFIRNKFYNNDKPIEYNYKNNNIVISCGFCQIGFKHESKSSIWIGQHNIFINIKQKQQDFLEILQKNISIDIQNIKVELFYQDQLYAIFSNGLLSALICIKLQFEDINDLLQFQFDEHKIAEIRLNFKDFQNGYFKKSFFYKQMKSRNNFSFIISDIVTILSFKEEAITQGERESIKKSLKEHDLHNSNKMNLNTDFKIQFYKDFVLQNQIESNSLSSYDINFYVNKSSSRQILTKIRYNLSETKNRKVFEIELLNPEDVIEIIQSYFFQIQNIQSLNIKLKLNAYALNSSKDCKELQFFEKINKINFFKTKITKLSLKLYEPQEFQLISQLKNLTNFSLEIQDSYQLFQFQEINSIYFRNQKNLTDLEVQFCFIETINSYQKKQQKILMQTLIDKISINYQNLVNLSIFNTGIEYDSFFNQPYKKFKRLTHFQCKENQKSAYKQLQKQSYYYDDYEYMNYIKSQILIEKIMEEDGKVNFAYLLVDNHDNIACSYSRREFCTCSNNLMQKILKKPEEYFLGKFIQLKYDSSWQKELEENLPE